MTQLKTFKEYALAYLKAGYSPIPLGVNNLPTYEWYKFSKNRMNVEEVDHYFKEAKGVGVICGQVSGGLMCIDIDTKYFDEAIDLQDVKKAIPNSILKKVKIIKTRSGGRHLLFKTTLNKKNQKLAMRETTEEERKKEPSELVKVLIETRAEGGIIFTLGTPGYTDLTPDRRIKLLTDEEVECLLEVGVSFNRVLDQSVLFGKFKEEHKNKFLQSPFEVANERMDVLGLLMSHGYSTVGSSNSEGDIKVKRPGSTVSTHSGYYKATDNKYVNFSTSSLLNPGKIYTASELFTILECNGDWSESFKRLIDRGYGQLLDMSKQVNDFIKLFKEGNIDELIRLHFDATLVRGGYMINNTFFPKAQ